MLRRKSLATGAEVSKNIASQRTDTVRDVSSFLQKITVKTNIISWKIVMPRGSCLIYHTATPQVTATKNIYLYHSASLQNLTSSWLRSHCSAKMGDPRYRCSPPRLQRITIPHSCLRSRFRSESATSPADSSKEMPSFQWWKGLSWAS